MIEQKGGLPIKSYDLDLILYLRTEKSQFTEKSKCFSQKTHL